MSTSLPCVSPHRSLRLAFAAVLGLLAAGAVAPNAAQAQDFGKPLEEPLLLKQVRALEMDSLQRGRATVHFTPGHRKRAEWLALRIDRELRLFADSLGTELKQFHLILPDRDHWEQLAEWPYGVPVNGTGGWQERNLGRHVPGRPPSGIVPADGEGAVYEQLLTLKKCAPTKYRERLNEMDLSWEEAARRYVEAIAFHEVGHAVSDAYKIRQPLWLGEFFPNVLTYAYLQGSEPTHAEVWDLMTAVTLKCQRPSHDRTLEAALRLGQSADDYHWFQSFLIQRANRVVEAHGFDFLRKVPGAFPPRSKASSDPLWDKVDALEQRWDQLSDEEALRRLREINGEMLRRLERIAPGFQEWARRFERDNAGTARNSGSKASQERPLLEQVRALKMDSLRRGRVTVHFTPGHRDRAERLAPRVGRELQLFADSLGARLESFHLILPGQAHWKQLTEGQPYGVPKSLGAWQRDNMPPEQAKSAPLHPPAALVPADAEGAVYEQLLALKKCAPVKYRERLKQAGFSWEEAARRYVEAITFHEVAHLITDTDAYQVGMPLWFREFLANVFGYAYMHHGEPTYAEVWDVMTAVTLKCQKPTHGRTLPKAERLGQSAGDYHWFQSFLIQRANRVVETHGFDFLRMVPEAFPPRSSARSDPLWDKVDALEKRWDQLSDKEALRHLREINEEMLRRLERIATGFQEWARRFQAGESGRR